MIDKRFLFKAALTIVAGGITGAGIAMLVLTTVDISYDYFHPPIELGVPFNIISADTGSASLSWDSTDTADFE